MAKRDETINPTHGFCAVCTGPIVRGVKWTFTGMLNRVHADRDDCIAVLHPKLYQAFLKTNPHYKSDARVPLSAYKIPK